MSELSDNIRREQERMQSDAIRRLVEADNKFYIDVDSVLRSRARHSWKWYAKKVVFFVATVVVLFLCIWGAMAL